MKRRQEQSGGDGSVNIQSGMTTNISVGLSASEARQIALDVSRAQLFEMRDIAQNLVDARLNAFTEEIIKKARLRNPDALGVLINPDIQYVLSMAGRDYARSGESWLMDRLVSLLVERFMTDGSTLRALALNEAISVVSRLTKRHVSTLTSIWMLHHIQLEDVKTLEDLGAWISDELEPILSDACSNDADYQYLLYTGCVSADFMPCAFADLFRTRYPGIFSNGIERTKIEVGLEDYESAILEHRDLIFHPAPDEPGLLIPKFASIAQVYSWAESIYSLEAGDKLKMLIEEAVMDTQDAGFLLMEAGNCSYSVYEDSLMAKMSLTTVGKVIAHSHWSSRTKQPVSLDRWVPNDDD